MQPPLVFPQADFSVDMETGLGPHAVQGPGEADVEDQLHPAQGLGRSSVDKEPETQLRGQGLNLDVGFGHYVLFFVLVDSCTKSNKTKRHKHVTLTQNYLGWLCREKPCFPGCPKPLQVSLGRLSQVGVHGWGWGPKPGDFGVCTMHRVLPDPEQQHEPEERLPCMGEKTSRGTQHAGVQHDALQVPSEQGTWIHS